MPYKDKSYQKSYYKLWYLKNKTKFVEYNRTYRRKHKEEVNAYQRKYFRNRRRTDPEFRERAKEYFRKSYRKHRAKRLLAKAKSHSSIRYKAGKILSRQILKGTIIRPKSCEACGAKGKIQGHHPDYSKPLSVIWLCIFCHCTVHHKK